MALSLVYEDASGTLQAIVFDAVVRELHAGSAAPTEHAMETGVNQADHVRPERARLTIDGFVTNAPIVGGVQSQVAFERPESVMVSSAQASGGPSSFPLRIPGRPTPAVPVSATAATREEKVTTIAGNFRTFPTRFDRVRDVYQELDQLRRAGSTLRVLTHLRDYESMVIASLSAPRDTQDAITFTLELVEVVFSSTELVDAPIPKEKRAQKTKPQGPKAPYALDEQTESIAHAQVFEPLMGLMSRDSGGR